MGSLSLVMCECSLSGRGQGHVSNFYIHLSGPLHVYSIGLLRCFFSQEPERRAVDTADGSLACVRCGQTAVSQNW